MDHHDDKDSPFYGKVDRGKSEEAELFRRVAFQLESGDRFNRLLCAVLRKTGPVELDSYQEIDLSALRIHEDTHGSIVTLKYEPEYCAGCEKILPFNEGKYLEGKKYHEECMFRGWVPVEPFPDGTRATCCSCGSTNIAHPPDNHRLWACLDCKNSSYSVFIHFGDITCVCDHVIKKTLKEIKKCPECGHKLRKTE